MSDIRVKICGLTSASAIDAAVRHGAAYLGFNFFPKSPRYVSPEQAAKLAGVVEPGVAKVALTVNADDTLLETLFETVPLDMFQLHGGESDAVLSAQSSSPYSQMDWRRSIAALETPNTGRRL